MGLVLAVVTAIPYVYAYAVQPQGHVFIGFFYLGDGRGGGATQAPWRRP